MPICHKHPFQYFHHHLVWFILKDKGGGQFGFITQDTQDGSEAAWWLVTALEFAEIWNHHTGSFWGRDVRLAAFLWWSDPSSGNTRDIHSRGGAKISSKYRQNTIQHNLMCLSLSLSKYDMYVMLYCMHYVHVTSIYSYQVVCNDLWRCSNSKAAKTAKAPFEWWLPVEVIVGYLLVPHGLRNHNREIHVYWH